MSLASLGRAALMGGAAGLGLDCLTRDREKSFTLAGIILGVALQALALCFGSSVALGAGVGLFLGALIITKEHPPQDDRSSILFGGALVGAVFGGIFGLYR